MLAGTVFWNQSEGSLLLQHSSGSKLSCFLYDPAYLNVLHIHGHRFSLLGGLDGTVMFSEDKAQSKQAVNYKDFEASK